MASTEKQLARVTPLWVISLFLSLTEVVTGIALTKASGGVQVALIAFVLIFPLLVATAFFIILWFRPYVLYPPADFGGGADVTSFVRAMTTPPPLPFAVTSNATAPATTGSISRLLALNSDTDVMVVLAEISPEEDEAALVGSGDALALALVQATLLKVEGIRVTAAVLRENRKATRDFFRSYRVVVVLGGPFGNDAAREIMDSSKMNLEFRPGGGVYDKREERMYNSTFKNDGMDGTDWAILVLTENPKRDGRVALLAGYTGYGTNAAGAVFANLGQYPEFAKHQSLEALIRVDIVDGVVEKPELIMVRAIDGTA